MVRRIFACIALALLATVFISSMHSAFTGSTPTFTGFLAFWAMLGTIAYLLTRKN